MKCRHYHSGSAFFNAVIWWQGKKIKKEIEKMNIWETIGDFILDNWEKIGILLAIIFKKNETAEEKDAKKLAKLKKKETKQAQSLQKTLKKQAEIEEKGGQ